MNGKSFLSQEGLRVYLKSHRNQHNIVKQLSSDTKKNKKKNKRKKKKVMKESCWKKKKITQVNWKRKHFVLLCCGSPTTLTEAVFPLQSRLLLSGSFPSNPREMGIQSPSWDSPPRKPPAIWGPGPEKWQRLPLEPFAPRPPVSRTWFLPPWL